MNQVILMGRLCRDPEVRYSAEGLAVARYTLAIDRYTKESRETDFINCVAFGKRAEFADGKQNSSQPAPADADGFMNIPEGVDDELPFK